MPDITVDAIPMVRKRDGRVVPFNLEHITSAIAAAFAAELKASSELPLEDTISPLIVGVGRAVQDNLLHNVQRTDPTDVEDIQDMVETELMRHGHYNVARRYIVYRQERARIRALRGEAELQRSPGGAIQVRAADGSPRRIDVHALKRLLYWACRGLPACNPDDLINNTLSSLYDGIPESEVIRAATLAARARLERDPAYDLVATRLLLETIYREVFDRSGHTNGVGPMQFEDAAVCRGFSTFIEQGIQAGLLAGEMAEFDHEELAAALKPDRDQTFTYLGLQTLYDRYLLCTDRGCIELPQYMWMRVAMGLALHEGIDRNRRAVEFYEVLSSFRFVSATPTLFNSGTRNPQLSSCYLSTVRDDLAHIFKVIGDNAALSKWAGGLGNDWTPIRAVNARIHGTHGQSQGVIPFLKMVNDTAVAVNQGGKRKGAVCAYMEMWHLEIEDFMQLRKNTGDERRRTHDMHTAAWIPDLFMRRVAVGADWTLFSPDEVSDLHDLYGAEFEKRYLEYERYAASGSLRQFKTLPAMQLWRQLLTMLFETGHPWITFKDPSNIRSPQAHTGVVHCSNLCTEILLNTSPDETAVCNLGSINLARHVNADGVDKSLLEKTITTALRMLDNVIDINFYPTPEARQANLRHRPVGLGIMGYQDALFKLKISYASEEAITFADQSMEVISYYAILASADLARQRGTYSSYKGSKWDQGLVPIDTLELLQHSRGEDMDVNRSAILDWDVVRARVKTYGMRNSNVLAIAPTATISNIAGCTQSIEPLYQNLFAKSNLSGDFTMANAYLVADLKALGLWDQSMVDDIKYYDGSIQHIERIPEAIRLLYRTAFEIEPRWIIEAASRRQKWIDMGQSLNLYISRPSGQALNDMYFLAWRKGLKTTYYLRGQAATQIEKSTMQTDSRGIQPRWMKNVSASARVLPVAVSESIQTGASDLDQTPAEVPACLLENPGCEACQ